MYFHWTGDCHPIIENGTTDVKYRLRFGDRVTTSVFRRTASQKYTIHIPVKDRHVPTNTRIIVQPNYWPKSCQMKADYLLTSTELTHIYLKTIGQHTNNSRPLVVFSNITDALDNRSYQ